MGYMVDTHQAPVSLPGGKLSQSDCRLASTVDGLTVKCVRFLDLGSQPLQ